MWSGTTEKEAEFVLKQTLQHIVLTKLHPNTAISVIVQVIYEFRLIVLFSPWKTDLQRQYAFVRIILSGLINIFKGRSVIVWIWTQERISWNALKAYFDENEIDHDPLGDRD